MSGSPVYECRTALGFVWPAYQCFKDVENNKSTHRKWCIYWIVIVLYTSLERVADMFVFWLPLYSELKIGMVYFLACANGTEYIYERMKETLRSRMFGLIVAVQQFQSDQQTDGTSTRAKSSSPTGQWQIPAIPASTSATAPDKNPEDSPETTVNKRSRRRFGLR